MLVTTVMGNYRPINGYVVHIFSPVLPVVFTVLRTYILVRPINGYVDTHIFTFSTCRIYCIKDVYACNHGNG